MLRVNPTQRERIREFVDQDHKVMISFYDLLESSLSDDELLKQMKGLITLDKDFYESYIAAAEILFSQKKINQAISLLTEAYNRALMIIVDHKGRWPQRILWGYLENRHIMRALEEYAKVCWVTGDLDEAITIFQNLLHANPYDNQGVRYRTLL